MLSERCHWNMNRPSFVLLKLCFLIFHRWNFVFSRRNLWSEQNKVGSFRVIVKVKMMPKKSVLSSRDIGVRSMLFNVIRISRKIFSLSAIGLSVSGLKKCETIVSCGPSNSKSNSSPPNSKINRFLFRPSMHALTDGQWSPTRSSIFYTTKMDGKILR